MLQVKNITPHKEHLDEHVFDFAEEETIGRALFEDDIDYLQHLLASQPEEGKKLFGNVHTFFDFALHFEKHEANRIEIAALFGSVKCFKYLMMNGDELNDDTCRFAIAGGNTEIIHLCEQKRLQFRDCLYVAVCYHRYELFEWLDDHFYFKDIPITTYLNLLAEPLFYLYAEPGQEIEIEDITGDTPINYAARFFHIGIVQYLYEKCNANVNTRNDFDRTPVFSAAMNGSLDIVKYLHETCHAKVEIIDLYDNTIIDIAKLFKHPNIIKYIRDDCHANI
jgi:hypothetical protein